MRKYEGELDPRTLKNTFAAHNTVSNYHCWLMKVSMDSDTLKLTCDYTTDSILLKHSYAWSCTEYAPNSLILFSDDGGDQLILIRDWKVIKVIMDPIAGNGNKNDIRCLPNFDLNKFPFMVCSGKLNYNLVNVKTFEIAEFI